MPYYDIFFRNEDGSLAARISAPCPDDTRAKVLAHAMKKRDHKTFEVWDGDTLVYERPGREH